MNKTWSRIPWKRVTRWLGQVLTKSLIYFTMILMKESWNRKPWFTLDSLICNYHQWNNSSYLCCSNRFCLLNTRNMEVHDYDGLFFWTEEVQRWFPNTWKKKNICRACLTFSKVCGKHNASFFTVSSNWFSERMIIPIVGLSFLLAWVQSNAISTHLLTWWQWASNDE